MDLEVGTKIFIEDAGYGARGCDNQSGTVVRSDTESRSGLTEGEPHIKVNVGGRV